MESLKKINDNFYSYFDKANGMLFTLSYGDYGVLNYGKAYYLALTYGNSKEHIATFCVKDDGYRRYERCYGHCIWKNINEILEHANRMINDFIDDNQ